MIDWTQIIVALIGLLATVLTTLMTYAWKVYVRPWLETHELTESAKIAVNAAEAILGRHMGAEKWEYAVNAMKNAGFEIDNEAVINALKAAWNEMNLSQIMAGEKEK